MSLQVWLPLTKDLRQQGLSNVTVTNNGVTYSATGGKLGGCYVFDGSDDSIGIGDLSALVNTDFTFACWFYHDDTWSSKGYETLLGGPSGFELESKVSTTNSPVLKLYNWGGGSCVYELNKWNHVVFTRNTTETKLYLNGELQVTGTAGTIPSGNYFIGAWKTSAQQNFKGNMNDVRIYDHCLSPMEVKELAKGLVLHYPLDRQGWGQENLLKESHVAVNTTSYAMHDYYFVSGKAPVEGQTYTVQLKGQLGTGKTYFGLYNSGGSISCVSLTPATQQNGIYKATFTWRTSTASNTYLRVYHMASSTSATSTIEWIKLEEGSIATPWCPNTADTNNMGLNSTTEYDCSGFCNNGTRTGTFTWTSDTSKYSVSQYFNGSNYILTDSGTFSWFSFDKCTVAVWMKPTTTPSSWAGTFGIAHNNSSTNKSFVIGNYSGKFTMQSANGSWVNVQASNLPINEWHHCVATLDGTTIKMYFDGELVNTYTINWGSTTVASDTRVQVGIDLPGSDEIYQGYYSDARIYATALSASDVKSLYQNCATIDPDGTIRGQIRS